MMIYYNVAEEVFPEETEPAKNILCIKKNGELLEANL